MANGKGPPGLGIPVFWNCNLLCQFHNFFVRKQGRSASWECVGMPFPFATSCGSTQRITFFQNKIYCTVMTKVSIPTNIKRQQ